MNFRKFVMALSDDELKALVEATRRERFHRAEMRVNNGKCEHLNSEERSMIQDNWISAIKAYRVRTGAGLIEAKYLVDQHRQK